MSLQSIEGLVIRTADWSESSRIATFFSKESGKLKGIAKGGKRIKSQFDNGLDLLTQCRLIILRKSTGGLDLITEAQVINKFSGITKSIHALHAAYHIAELLDVWTEIDDPHPNLYDACIQTLETLGNLGKTHQNQAIQIPLISSSLMSFEMATLEELGVKPELEFCTECKKQAGESIVFSPSGGGVKCRQCALDDRSSFRTTIAIVQTLKKLYPAPSEGLCAVELPMRKELRKLLNRYVTFLLGKRLKVQSYLESGGI